MNAKKECGPNKNPTCRFCGKKAVEYTRKGWLCKNCLEDEDNFHAAFS